MAREIRARGWGPWLREVAASEGISGETPYVKEFAAADTELVALELEEWTKWKGPVSVFPRLKMPGLRLLNGKQGKEEIARMRRAARAGDELHIIPGVDHWQICLEPRHTAPMIRDFLARVLARA